MKKKIFLGLVAIFLLLQFVPNDLPEVVKDNPNDFLANNEVPTEIESLLRASCYDCHSNETRYPWYSYVAPVSWQVSRDTRMGREHLNFSNWNSFEKSDMAEAFYEMAEEIEDEQMPMKIYPIMHWDANLSDDQRQAIASWAEVAAEKLYE